MHGRGSGRESTHQPNAPGAELQNFNTVRVTVNSAGVTVQQCYCRSFCLTYNSAMEIEGELAKHIYIITV